MKFIVVVWAALAGLYAGTAFAAAPSALDVMMPSTYAEVELSPSGRYLAFISTDTQRYCSDANGQMKDLKTAKCKDKYKQYRTTHEIMVYDIEGAEIVKKLGLPINVGVAWLKWASDERLLGAVRSVITVSQNGRGYALGGSRIMSFPVGDGESVALFEGEKSVARQNRNLSRITNMLRTDPDHIIMPAKRSGELDLWKVNVADGTAERVALGTGSTFYWFTNNEGEPVLRYDCKGLRCRAIDVFAKKENSDAWEVIKSFKTKPEDDSDDFAFWPVAPADQDGHFHVISNEDEAPRRTIKIYDIKARKYVKTVFDQLRMDVGGALLDNQTGEYSGAWYYDDRLVFEFADATLQQHTAALNAFFGDKENVDILGYNTDKTKLTFSVTATNNAGEYYIYDFNTSDAQRIFQLKPNLGERAETTTHILSVPTRDGTIVTAYHTVPNGAAPGEAPLLIMPHGGPERRDYYDYDARAQYFAQRGYQILTVNHRGSSGYGREFAEAGYGEWGGIMQNDVTDAVKYLQNTDAAAPEKTCIVGYSYGGYVALYGAATTPELYHCVVGGGGVYDIVEDLRESRSEYGDSSETFAYWEKSMGALSSDRDKLKAVSPVNLADNITAPVLLIHAEYDGIVDFVQMTRMKSALKRAGKDYETLRLNGEGHSNWSLETDILYLETIEAFLEKHLR